MLGSIIDVRVNDILFGSIIDVRVYHLSVRVRVGSIVVIWGYHIC